MTVSAIVERARAADFEELMDMMLTSYQTHNPEHPRFVASCHQ